MTDRKRGRPNLTLVPPSDPDLTELLPTAPLVEPAPPSPARLWAEEAYFTFRRHPSFTTRTATMDQLLSILATKRDRLPPDAPPADRGLLETWEREGGWELRYREDEVKTTLNEAGLQPDRRLSALLTMERDAYEVLQQSMVAAKFPGALKDDVAKYTSALTAWTNLQTKIAEAEADTRRRTFETGEKDLWKERYQEIYGSLMANYQDLGPQYEVIVAQLARHQVRMERAEASGRDIPLAEYNEGTKQIIALVGQLQKYTESTKSEAIHKEQQEAILAVLRLVEDELSEYPNLWRSIARRVHQRVTGTTVASA